MFSANKTEQQAGEYAILQALLTDSSAVVYCTRMFSTIQDQTIFDDAEVLRQKSQQFFFFTDLNIMWLFDKKKKY